MPQGPRFAGVGVFLNRPAKAQKHKDMKVRTTTNGVYDTETNQVTYPENIMDFPGFWEVFEKTGDVHGPWEQDGNIFVGIQDYRMPDGRIFQSKSPQEKNK